MHKSLRAAGGIASLAIGLSACGAPSVDDPRIAFNQAYQNSAENLAAIAAMSPTVLSSLPPSGVVSYSGLSGMAVSVDDNMLGSGSSDPEMTESEVLVLGDDFLAVADVTMNIDLSAPGSPTFSGNMTIIEADESQALTGQLTFTNVAINPDASISTATDTVSVNLTHNGNPVTGTGQFTSGFLVGSSADAIHGGHRSDLNGGGIIVGGFYATKDN